MKNQYNISPKIHIEIISDRESDLKKILNIPTSIIRNTLTWKDSYSYLSYENTLFGAPILWLLDLSHPNRSNIKYYAHVFNVLAELAPFVLLDKEKSGPAEYRGIFKWISSQNMCAVYKYTDVEALASTIRKILDSTAYELIRTINLSIHGLEVQFYDDEIHVVGIDYIKSLLGRNDGKISNINIGRDRTFIKIRFSDESDEYVPSDMLRVSGDHDSESRSTIAYSKTATTIGERIRRFREQAMLTQLELGEKVGKSRHTIMRFESGQILPKVSDLERISEAVNMDLLQFLSEKPTLPGRSHHIVPNPSGGWDIRRGGSSRRSGHFDTKREAEVAGREISRNQGTEFIIHGSDGKIQRPSSPVRNPKSSHDKH